MSASDLFWTEDPLPVTKVKAMSYDHWKTTEPDPNPTWNAPDTIGVTGRCEQCWRPAYGSFPGHVLCREHMLEHQNTAIAAIVARAQRRAS